MSPIWYVVLTIVIAGPIIAIAIHNTLAERRLPAAERRRRAAIKRWGSKNSGGGIDESSRIDL